MDATKDVIVSCLSGTQYSERDLKPYVESINASGFRGVKLVITDTVSELNEYLRTSGFTVVELPHDIRCISIRRWEMLYNWLSDNDVRYVVSCDFRDVIVQTDPSVWLEEHIVSDPAALQSVEIIAASEALPIFRDATINSMWIERLYGKDTAWVKDNDIICAGTVAGTAEKMRQLSRRIVEDCSKTYHWGDDQAAVNKLLRTEFADCTFVPKNRDAWTATVTWFVSDSQIPFRRYLTDVGPYLKDGTVYAPDSYKAFCIVHQYDRSMAWRNSIFTKYKVKFSATAGSPHEGFPTRTPIKYASDGLTIDWWSTHTR